MQITLYIIQVFRFILTVFFGGDRCVCCGNITFQPPLCRYCEQDRLFSYTPAVTVTAAGKHRSRCCVCGRPLVSERDVCMECRDVPVLKHTATVFPVHTYCLWKKQLLFLWKTVGMRQLSPVFARLVAYVLRNEFPPNLPVIPVPPRPGKIRRTGWDQIEELCSFLEHQYKYTVLRVLERTTEVQQKTLGRSARLKNREGTYRLKKNGKKYIRLLEEIILVDDVMTTGATIEACAQILSAAGIKKVHVVTLFSVC